MAKSKTPPKPKKGSKLASIKKAILGMGKTSATKVKAPVKAAAKKTPPVKIAKAPKAAPAPKIAVQKAAPLKAAVAAPLTTHAKLPPNPKAAAQAANALKALRKKHSAKNLSMEPEDIAARTAGIRAALEASGETVCREVACEGLSTTGGYCRLHYIKNWKKIKRKELILKEKKLNSYIEELVAKYPDKYIDAIRQDLANDKDFAKVIYDLDLDEDGDDFDENGESAEGLIDNIKRDFEDNDDGF